jgi:hypothetical protein
MRGLGCRSGKRDGAVEGDALPRCGQRINSPPLTPK